MKIYGMFIKIVIIIFVIFTLFVLGMFLAGYEPAIIVTGSMKPKMPVGTIAFIDKSYPYEQFQTGDILVYTAGDIRVVHRVVEVNEKGYRTKGDAREKMDTATITKDIYYGKCVFYIPYAGLVVMAFQSTMGKISLLIIIASLCVTYYFIKEIEKYKN